MTLFQSRQDGLHVYHNLTHTQFVVASATQIANHYMLNEKDFFIVIAAAWFHDAGYFFGIATGHEQRGAEMAVTFLLEKGVPGEVADQVKRCILATDLPQ